MTPSARRPVPCFHFAIHVQFLRPIGILSVALAARLWPCLSGCRAGNDNAQKRQSERICLPPLEMAPAAQRERHSES